MNIFTFITPKSVFLGLTRFLAISSSLKNVYAKAPSENLFDELDALNNPLNNIGFETNIKILDNDNIYDNPSQFKKDKFKYTEFEKTHDRKQKTQEAEANINLRKKTTEKKIAENTDKFFSAIDKGSIHDLEKAKSVNINAVDDNGHTALHIIADKNFNHLTQYLLKKGIDVNIEDNMGRTAIFYATSRGNNKMVEAIFPYVKNIDHADKDKVTILLIASYNQNHDLVNLFLSKSPNINWQDTYGRTSLHYAAYLSDNILIKSLLKAGGNSQIANNKGKIPIDIAQELENDDMANIIKTHAIASQDNTGWVGYLLGRAEEDTQRKV